MIKKYTTAELVGRKGDVTKLKDKPRNEVYLVLDNIRSVHNVGAIFRTADATRVKKIFLCGITPHPPRVDLEKTALGTIEHLPWEHCKSAKLKVKNLKRNGIQIVALEQTDASIDYRQFKYKKPCAIVLGNEVEGIDDDVLALCDGVIDIPMYGIANSLNVTTTAGIVLYYLI
jgi:23S rRNA (guanosine2251-2'-O)-methyltransferase